jgi:streptogramin lyase
MRPLIAVLAVSAIAFPAAGQNGPGDPSRVLLSNGIQFSGIAAAPNGDMFVLENGRARVLRLSSAGDTSVFVSFDNAGWSLNGGLVFDKAGNLLAPGQDGQTPASVVFRFSPAGQRSVFTRLDYANAFAITVGPDGDVWVNEDGGSTISRFDSAGNSKGTVNVSVDCAGQTLRASVAAFSPAGELHFTAQMCGGVWKLVNGAPQQVISSGRNMHGLAFDQDGYLYVSNPGVGIQLYDPQYHVASDPFARSNLSDPSSSATVPDPHAIAFARAADGSMTKRILALTGSTVVELNSAGVRAPGWQIGKQSGNTTMAIPVQDIARALMGGSTLTAEQVQYLDTHGNHNGVLDVGDLRAYLRAQGQLAGSAQR